MTNQLFEAALGIKSPWFVQAVAFDASPRRLTVGVVFAPGSRFAHPKTTGEHPVYDTQIKRLRHLNFFQHECHLEVRVPRVRLPDGRVALVEPDWVGKLSGFTLLFEALELMLAQQMTFAAVARIVGETWHRVHAICSRYVDLALTHAETCRRSVFVADGRDARHHRRLCRTSARPQGRSRHVPIDATATAPTTAVDPVELSRTRSRRSVAKVTMCRPLAPARLRRAPTPTGVETRTATVATRLRAKPPQLH